MNIYLDVAEFDSIDQFLEENEGVFGSDDMERAFDRLSLSLPANIEKAGAAYLELKAHEATIKNEIARLRQMQTREQAKAENIKKTLKYALSVLKTRKMPFDTFSVSVRKSPDKLPDEIEERLVPDDCFDIIPETRKVSRKRLLAKVKKEDIDGIDLIKNRSSVVIS